MQHGFKTYANSLALDARRSVGLTQLQPLDCGLVADELGIECIEFSQLEGAVSRESWEHLVIGDSGVFSALTVFDGTIRTVVVNNFHHPNRQRSSLAHEIAHALLLHPPLPVHTVHENGHRNSEQEQEAAFLAGALLVPEEACLAIVRRELRPLAAASEFGVSEDLMVYRLRVSGATVRRQRELARRR